jgi:glycosyltransferase involved in cell wall biosynthesis/GT2 family glycosyltransferase
MAIVSSSRYPLRADEQCHSAAADEAGHESSMPFRPSISIVINTDGRARSLEATLRSLRYLNYPNFEVCVVYGPTPDGTREMLEAWRGQIKIAACDKQNLSMSRNIGIALAAGEIVAFIDDDAIPEPEWLDDLAAAYAAPNVGAAGGFVYNHTGVAFQWTFGTVDRLARPDLGWDRAVPELCFPYTTTFPHLLGTNSSLRRQAAIAIGGFDEEFDYFLDETDVLARLVDAGWKVAQLGNAYVHHKYKASHIRDESHVLRAWYSIVKNKIYYSLLNAHGHHSIQQAIEEAINYIGNHRNGLKWAISVGRLDERDLARFHDEIERAWRDGLQRGLSGHRRLLTQEVISAHAQPFLRFDILVPSGGRRTLCLLSQGYPPGPMGGIARYVHQLARSIAALGHQVHVMTQAADHDTVDFEEGVWVHRIRPKPSPRELHRDIPVPENIWNHSATMLSEVRKVATVRPVDAVLAAIWDCEGVAFLLEDDIPLITSLVTTFKFWAESRPQKLSDAVFVRDFFEPMLTLEAMLMEQSAGVIAISEAIARDVENAYNLRLDPSRLGFVPLGIEDASLLPSKMPDPLPPGMLRVVFVGRLEERKGIDVFLEAIREVLPDYPNVHVDIVGNDRIPGPGDVTYRAAFEADARVRPIHARVAFHGEVPDEVLRGFYRACDVFVAPSRYESFGLILVEAMIFSRPVIGCKAGGMVEIVEHGVSGMLAEPGDVSSLTSCLRQLLDDPSLRARLGEAGRARYEQFFSAKRMADEVLRFVSKVCPSRLPKRQAPA